MTLQALRTELQGLEILHGVEIDRTKRGLASGGLDGCAQGNIDLVGRRQGGATGADRLAAAWALHRGMPCAEVKAQWKRLGLKAGPIRNEWMLALDPHMVVAFPGGDGTQNMVAKATARGVYVYAVSEVRGEP